MFANTIAGKALSGDSPGAVSRRPDKAVLNRKIKNLYQARREYELRWREIRDYQLPYVGEFDDTADRANPGRRRDLAVVHGVAWMANQVFAAGILSGLTPPSRQWFRLAYKRPELNSNVEACRLLDERQEIIAHVLAKSNFYNSVHSCYLELPFGQAPLAIFADPVNGVRFQAQTIGTYALGTDGFGRVTTFAKKYWMTLQQVADRFGLEALPPQLQEVAKNDVYSDRKYQVNWLVEPNTDRILGYDDNLNMPYRSVYWLDKSGPDEFLYIGGFEEWPVPTGRYLVSGLEAYGRGPGWFAEGDSKMLQLLKKDYLTAVELNIKPPMKGPANLMHNGGINLIPGGLTPVDDQSQQYVQPLFNVNLDLNHAQQEIIRVEDSIKRYYSADLFRMLDGIENTRMTAREVVERTQEKLQQLGPVVERLQDEFLNLILARVYNILDREGAFPPIPEELLEILDGEDIDVDYISPLAQAQKMSGLVNIEQGLAQVAQMAQIWPEVTNKIDPIRAISKYFEMLGAPAIMQRSAEELSELEARQQAAAQEQQAMAQGLAVAQAAAPIADAAKNLTQAANDANPAVNSWLGM